MNTKKTTSAFWRRFAFSFSVLGLLGACAGQIPHVSPAQRELAGRQWPNLTPESLEEGRRLFIFRCSGCHTLPLPSAHSAAEWPGVIGEMAERAGLNAQQMSRITQYLVAVRTESSGPAKSGNI